MADLINILWYNTTQGLFPFFIFIITIFLILFFEAYVSSPENQKRNYFGMVFIGLIAGTIASFVVEHPRYFFNDIILFIKYVFLLFKWWSISLCFVWIFFRWPALKKARYMKITPLLLIGVSLLSVTLLKYTYADNIFLKDVKFWENVFKTNNDSYSLNEYKKHISSHAESYIAHTLYYDYQGAKVSGPLLKVLYKIYTSDNIYSNPFRKIAIKILSDNCYPGTNIINHKTSLLYLIAAHKNLSKETFYEIYNKFASKESILCALCRNESATQEFLQMMTRHPSHRVKLATVFNKGASENILSQLEDNEKTIIEVEKRKKEPDPVVLNRSRELLSAISQMRRVRNKDKKNKIRDLTKTGGNKGVTGVSHYKK